MLRLGVKQTTGTSRIQAMSQKSVTDLLTLQDTAIGDLQDVVSELENRQTFFIDYWTDVEPATPENEEIWFDSFWDRLYINMVDEWLEIPLSEKSIYVKRSDNTQYAFNGYDMVVLTVPLTKATIEGLLTGDIYSHTHTVRTIALPAYAIDLASGEDFTKVCGANSQFTITNPILKKPFRLIITGGTLQVPTFSGYTVNWILASLVTDYVPATTNYLWCEIRSAGQIYCFWGG